jgi:hypothetical protein
MTPLAELRKRVKREAPFIGVKPYSHNIVRLTLAQIAQDHGRAEANEAVREFNLESRGFNTEPENE